MGEGNSVMLDLLCQSDGSQKMEGIAAKICAFMRVCEGGVNLCP